MSCEEKKVPVSVCKCCQACVSYDEIAGMEMKPRLGEIWIYTTSGKKYEAYEGNDLGTVFKRISAEFDAWRSWKIQHAAQPPTILPPAVPNVLPEAIPPAYDAAPPVDAALPSNDIENPPAPQPIDPEFHPGPVIIVGTYTQGGDYGTHHRTETRNYAPGKCPVKLTITTPETQGGTDFFKQTCTEHTKVDGVDVFAMKYETWMYDSSD